MVVRTSHHSREWLQTFRREVSAIANVIDFYRIAGEHDHMLKIVAEDMNDYDSVYRGLIEKLELETVTPRITMKTIVNSRDLPI